MSDFLKYSLLSTDSNECNSLEGLTGYSDLDAALVQLPNRYFRFFAASTETPNGVSIIAPRDVIPPAAGRWIQQGSPGPVGPNPKLPVNLACV